MDRYLVGNMEFPAGYIRHNLRNDEVFLSLRVYMQFSSASTGKISEHVWIKQQRNWIRNFYWLAWDTQCSISSTGKLTCAFVRGSHGSRGWKVWILQQRPTERYSNFTRFTNILKPWLALPSDNQHGPKYFNALSVIYTMIPFQYNYCILLKIKPASINTVMTTTTVTCTLLYAP